MASPPPDPRAVVFVDGQNLFYAAKDAKLIARQQNRWIRLACAFPCSPVSRNRRGVDKTDWIRIERATYDRCIDRRDYRPKRPRHT